jgi:CxxC motif-containing protein (DUF1111 family)
MCSRFKRFRVLGAVLLLCVLSTRPIRAQLPTGALPGLSLEEAAQYRLGQVEFLNLRTAATGLGPLFNHRSCDRCHLSGGPTRQISVIIGTSPQALLLGGPQIQLESLPGIPAEKTPNNIPVGNRRAMRTDGLGLVASIPDAAILAEQARQLSMVPSMAGKANIVVDAVTGQTRVGRVGQKCQHPNPTSFAAEAFLREMGITTPFFPNEEAPYNDPGKLHYNPAPGINAKAEAVLHVGKFMDLSAPPSRTMPLLKTKKQQVQWGETIFVSIGCAECHTPNWSTGDNPVWALSNKVFHPYSDFLLHDMSSSGDQIQQGTDNANQPIPGSWMRTTPLWGCRDNPFLWHDGRIPAGDYAGAIHQHDGQGLAARQLFQSLSSDQKQALLAFLDSL